MFSMSVSYMKRELEYVQGPTRPELEHAIEKNPEKMEDLSPEEVRESDFGDLLWHCANRRSARILHAVDQLGEPCPSRISSETGISFDQTIEALHSLGHLGVLKPYKSGSERYFELTPLGEALSGKLSEIEAIFLKWPGEGDWKNRVQAAKNEEFRA